MANRIWANADRDRETELRGEQWRRTMFISEALMGTRFGLSINELRHAVNDRFGVKYNERTYRRDLELLESLGLVDQEGHGGNFRWVALHDQLAKTVLSAVVVQHEREQPKSNRSRRRPVRPNRNEAGQVRPRWASLQAALDQLPPPWDLNAAQMRAATKATRVLAMIDTRDRRYAKAMLIYRLGEGWTLQRPDVEAPASLLRSMDADLDDQFAGTDNEVWEVVESHE